MTIANSFHTDAPSIAARRLESIEAWGRRTCYLAVAGLLVLSMLTGGVLYLVVDYVRAKQAVSEAMTRMQAELPRPKRQMPVLMPSTTRKPPSRSRKQAGGGSAPKRGPHAVVDFINSLYHTGDYIGVLFQLRPWQEDIIRKMFSPDGEPLYRTVFIGIPRKQGKTELVAAILLYLMFGTGKKGQRIFSASGDREQAALIHGAAASMVRQSDALSAVSQIHETTKQIKFEQLQSIYKALSSEAKNQYGLRPSVLIFDEFWVLPNRDLYNATTTGFGATRKPLVIIISTAGSDRTSLCWEQWDYARSVRDGLIDDPTFLPILFETDPDDDWTDEAVWHKAMPALGDFCELDFIRAECKKAQALPAYENSFRQLYLNQWTEQAERWISVHAWTACRTEEPLVPFLFDGKPCYCGYDHGIVGDMAAFVILIPDGNGGYDVLGHCWAPKHGRWRNEIRNKDRYLKWSHPSEGWLTLTEDNQGSTVVNKKTILEDILRWVGPTGRFYPRLLLADRAYAMELLIDLQEAGIRDERIKGISQGPVTLNEAMVRFEELVLSRQVRSFNPILDWNIGNASITRTSTGLMCLDKSNVNERIDLLAALINALTGAVSDPENNGPSVWDDPNHRIPMI